MLWMILLPVTWKVRAIEVCWSDLSDPSPNLTDEDLNLLNEKAALVRPEILSNEVKSGIREVITREFSKERTGISFSRWGPCRSESTVFIVAGSKARIEGLASLGEGKKKGFVFLKTDSSNKLSFLQRLQLTALHEFGHVAGLRHEHSRVEVAQDPMCEFTSVY